MAYVSCVLLMYANECAKHISADGPRIRFAPRRSRRSIRPPAFNTFQVRSEAQGRQILSVERGLARGSGILETTMGHGRWLGASPCRRPAPPRAFALWS